MCERREERKGEKGRYVGEKRERMNEGEKEENESRKKRMKEEYE